MAGAHVAKGGDDRLTFEEAMSLAVVPYRVENGNTIKRFMSLRSAWFPGADLPWPEAEAESGTGKAIPFKNIPSAYGGHVYSQAGMAASRALAETRSDIGDRSADKKLSLHAIHGFFPAAGYTDRPFIYEVTTVASNPSFHNLLVTARQPMSPSSNPAGDHFRSQDSDAPLGPVCFNAIVSFRPPGISQYDGQESSPLVRFSDVLRSRPFSGWDPAPTTDIDSIVAAFPNRQPGTFPGIDMRKVDLTAFNRDKPLNERRELILYRLISPLPAKNPDTHILVHAFESDRNGLLMLGNHAGFGHDFGRAASLSIFFVVHVNPEDALMGYGEDEWWIQEACFPRVEAGRGIVMSKIWNPKGVHVATGYQDGIIRRAWKPGERSGKL